MESKTERSLAPYAAAQRLAFAPLMFQAARAARDLELLSAIEARGAASATQLSTATKLTPYATGVLLDACEALELISSEAGAYRLTPSGWLWLHDEMTRINADFAHDVCWRGAEHLTEALRTGAPSGLKELVDAPTIYQALDRLPPEARRSWFRFDHFYSDQVFPLAKPRVLARQPRSLLDVGGNTGHWALAIAGEVPVTILDHPGQLEVALEAARRAGLAGRIIGSPMDLLDHSKPFPRPFDAVWMSQFLCCFGLDDVEQLLRRAEQALSPRGRLYVLDTFSDRQPNPVARYCLHATSLYFTVMANGTSRMYPASELLTRVERAGLELEEEVALGVSHTLLVCRRKAARDE